jgi:hypothetical protein
MRILIGGIVGVLFLLSCGEREGKGPYGVKAGVITYKIYPQENLVMTQIFSFDSYGRYQSRITRFKSETGEDRELLFIKTPEGIISAEGERGVRIPSDVDKLIEDMERVVKNSQIPPQFQQQILERIRAQKSSFEGKDPIEEAVKKISPSREDTFIGKNCFIYEVPEQGSLTVYIWEGIPLKILKNDGSVLEEAESVEIKESLPPETFVVPEGIQIEEYLERFKRSISGPG